MSQPSSTSGKLLAILILGLLGPAVLLLVPVISIFVTPLTYLLTTAMVVQALRGGMKGHLASTVICVAVLLMNFAAAYGAYEILGAFWND